MADTIANWAVKLSADATGLVQTLEGASKKTLAFTQQVTSHAKTLASGVNTALAGITRINIGAQASALGGIASSVLGVGAAFATGGIGAGVAAIAAGATAFISFTSRAMDAIASQEKLGRQVGLTAQQAAGLQELASRANITPEGMGEGLDKYARHLGQLRHELQSGQAGPMVEALEQLGLNAATFISLPVGEQFARLKEATQGLAPMEREAAMFQVLGRGAMQLAPLLRQPANELRNLDEIAQRSGYSISQAEAEMVGSTMRELKSIGSHISAMFSNLGQGAAVALAPIASFVGNVLKDILDKGQPLLKFVGAVALGLGGILLAPGLSAIAGVIVAWRGAVAVFEYFKPVLSEVWAQMQKLGTTMAQIWSAAKPVFAAFWDYVIGVWSGIFDMLPGLGLSFDSITYHIRDFGTTVEAVFRASAERILSFIEEMAGLMSQSVTQTGQLALLTGAEANGPMMQMLGGMQQNLAGIGNAAVNARNALQALPSLSAPGAGPQLFPEAEPRWMQGYRDMLTQERERLLDRDEREMLQLQRESERMRMGAYEFAQREGMLRLVQQERAESERILALRQSGDQIRNMTRTPLEAFRIEMQELNERMEGDHPLGLETFRRRALQLFEELEKHDQKQPDRSPAAVLAGSVQEQAAIVAAQRQDREASRTPQERAARTLERMEQQEMFARQQRVEMVGAIQEIMLERMGN